MSEDTASSIGIGVKYWRVRSRLCEDRIADETIKPSRVLGVPDKCTSGLLLAIEYVVSWNSLVVHEAKEAGGGGGMTVVEENLSQLVRQNERTVMSRGRTEMKFR